METASLRPPDGAVPPLASGDLFAGRFELQRPLGRGGMGEVWAARDRTLGRAVALKIFSNPGLGSRALERIRREVAVARELVHPNLVRYYDIHADGTRWGLSMEWVEGVSMQEKLERDGPLPEARVREVLSILAGALVHLHAHGVIHRDVKPSNILLADDGTAKLGDFGIVHIEAEEDLTRTGETMGTPTHMSPEQFQGRNLTPASDYYALGITIYQALAGGPPFNGTFGELAVQHLECAPPALPRGAATPAMRRLTRGLLIKDPSRRWGKNELERFLNGGRLPLLPRQKSAMLLGAGLVLMLGALGVFGMRLRHPEPTHLRTEGTRLSCYHGDRLLWTRDFPELSSACLSDVDGDGSLEAVVGPWVHLDSQKGGVRLEVVEKDGRTGIPLSLPVKLGAYFNGFTLDYLTDLLPYAPGRLGILFNHRMFYPTMGFIWDAQSRTSVFSIAQSGHLYTAIPFGRGAALEGINNRLLHQKVLVVTDDLAAGVPAGLSVVDDTNLVASRGVRAYHLVGSEATLRLEGPDSATLKIPGEPVRLLRPDATFEGMAPGSAGRSVGFIDEYRQIRDLMNQGGSSGLDPRLDRLIRESGNLGHTGYAVLFTALRAEALMRSGRAGDAVDAAVRGAEAHPAYAMDLRIQGGLYALLARESPKALEILRSASNSTYGGRREELRTILVWASMLESPRAGRTMLEAQVRYIADGLHWKFYMGFQGGWISLLERDAAAARAALAPALERDGMENHAAGFFLASILHRAFDAPAFDAYMARTASRPEYLHWIGALGKGDAAGASLHWTRLHEDAFHAPDSALMLALLRRARALYPALR